MTGKNTSYPNKGTGYFFVEKCEKRLDKSKKMCGRFADFEKSAKRPL